MCACTKINKAVYTGYVITASDEIDKQFTAAEINGSVLYECNKGYS